MLSQKPFHVKPTLSIRTNRKRIDAETIMKKLEEQSMEGLKHAKILASRIIQLGGTPSIKPLETPASGFSSSPEDPTDLVHVIQVILKGES